MKPLYFLALLLAASTAAIGANENLGASLIRHDLPLVDPSFTPSVYVDSATWCQYLITPKGCITPRMSNDGRHLCFNVDSLKNE
jgi:hypothetical protein